MSLLPTAVAASVAPTVVPPAQFLDCLAGLQKITANLEKYSKGSKDVTRALIVTKMRSCIDSFPGVVPTMNTKIGVRSRELGQYDATIISPGSIIAKAKIVNAHNLQEQDAVVFADSKRIRIFNLSENRLFYIEIKDWYIGGDVFQGKVTPHAYTDIFQQVYGEDLEKEDLENARQIMQIFINRLSKAAEFIAEKGLAKATLPSTLEEVAALRIKVVAEMMTALGTNLSRDPLGLVVGFALGKDLEGSLLELPPG